MSSSCLEVVVNLQEINPTMVFNCEQLELEYVLAINVNTLSLLVQIYRVAIRTIGALILLPQIAKPELGLQKYQKHHTELEGKIAVAEMGTKFHPQLGKLGTRITENINVCSSSTLCHCFCYLGSGM